MSTVNRDLWPDEIHLEDVISPEEILHHQASLLDEKTNGRLIGHVEKLTSADRIVLALEIEAPDRGTRIRLLEVQHRAEFACPARILPPEEPPDFLREQVYRPGFLDIPSAIPNMKGKWVKRNWIAASPTEFSDMIAQILASASAKALLLSLLAHPDQDEDSNGEDSSHA